MLSWLSGEPRAPMMDRSAGMGEASLEQHDDPPETPAHIFAARAFKHAIFGTPALPPTHRQPRGKSHSLGVRRSNTTASISRDHYATTTGGRMHENDVATQLAGTAPSPVRRPGILLTPGTCGTRRKTVSFDGRDGTMAAKTGPIGSSQHDAIQTLEGPLAHSKATLQPRRREMSAFAQKLRGPNCATLPHKEDEPNITLDMNEPRSTSGRYWKGEFDSKALSTATELRKLAKKEEVAKKYAKHRDSAAITLEDELREMKAKVARLEAQVQDLRDRLDTATRSSAPSKHRESMEGSEILVLASRAKDERILALDKENEGLRLEMRKLRNSYVAGRLSTSTTPAREQHSDIWADAGDGLPPATTPRRRSGQARPPLTQRDDNVGAVADVENRKSGRARKEGQLSDERREAALRRLEERKLARQEAPRHRSQAERRCMSRNMGRAVTKE